MDCDPSFSRAPEIPDNRQHKETNKIKEEGKTGKQLMSSPNPTQHGCPLQDVKEEKHTLQVGATDTDAESKRRNSRTLWHATLMSRLIYRCLLSKLIKSISGSHAECSMQTSSLSPTLQTSLAVHLSLLYRCLLNRPADINKAKFIRHS